MCPQLTHMHCTTIQTMSVTADSLGNTSSCSCGCPDILLYSAERVAGEQHHATPHSMLAASQNNIL